ncbi:MAG: photosystem II stability/assembly factor-like uncharacterized protein [Litorivivens sp.]|jgi:photosystem II stability/assembly factor-like uncharacterized protein
MKLTRLAFSLLALTCTVCVHAQKNKTPQATPAYERMQNEELRADLDSRSMVNGIPFKSVGPTIMSGRVTDIAVNPEDPTEFYVAYASGGLWQTTNNGASFNPIFDTEITLTIGAIAVDWTNDVIWIGSGENNSSRSSYAGTGIYQSANNGESWEYKGLPESHHIGRIILHPTDKNTLWIGVLGHLYSANEERGVYKSIDGGKSWKKTLYENENSGVIDMEINPYDPKHLYAATWQRTRRAWNFEESGAGSKVHESTDGGETWKTISGGSTGFPMNDGMGRIGLSLSAQSASDFSLYAIADNQNLRDEEDKVSDKLVKKDFLSMDKEAFDALDNTELQAFLEDSGFPSKHDSTTVKELVASGDINAKAIYEYLTDANASLFDRPVIGAEVYRLDSENWTKTHEGTLDDVVYSYGYYFGVISVHPTNPEKLFIAGVPILMSEDGGKTWDGINADNVHVDHHSIWINPNREGHIINGNDGGINISYDDGTTYYKCNSPAVGQFYSVNVDNAEPYNVYGGLQDNGVWKGPSTYEAGPGWHQEGDYPFEMLMGGDGMRVEIDNRDNDIVYTGYQFGHYYRLNLATDDAHYFHPSHELGERPLRWNWQTPVVLSSHNNDIIYMGSNRFHRSMDQGETWETLSDDLTNGGLAGDVPFGTISSISESTLRFGLIYLGTDDGRVHKSVDGGYSWVALNGKLPKNLWVTRIIASEHDKNVVYASMNGYRQDDFTPYIFKSSDSGKTWANIGQTLPHEPVNVIKEDPSDKEILYVGTDNGLYISIDQGNSFMSMNGSLPPVAIHDLVIQERDQDIVLGTHGRSLYIANLEHLHELTKVEADLVAFSMEPITHRSSWGESAWNKWLGFNEPEIELPLFAKDIGQLKIEILNDSNVVVKDWLVEIPHTGINYIDYDLTINKAAVQEDEKGNLPEAKKNGKHYLEPGEYSIHIKQGELTSKVELSITE